MARFGTITLLILLSGISTAFIGFVLGWSFPLIDARYGPAGAIWAVAEVMLPAFLCVFVHEAGHVIGGWLVGFRFGWMAVGPLIIVRQSTGVRIRLRLYVGGLTSMTPTDEHVLPRRIAVMAIGGPMASLLLAIVAYGTYAGFPIADMLLRAWVVMTAGYSFSVTIFSLLPIRLRGLVTDGELLWMLAGGGPQADRLCALFVLQGMSRIGRRPRDQSLALIRRAIELKDASLHRVAACMAAYAWALDSGNIRRAAIFLDEALALNGIVPSSFRGTVYLEAAYLEAAYWRNAVAAREWLQRAKGGLQFEPYSRLRAEAAVLLVEGQNESSAAKARAGLALIRNSHDTGEAQAEVDLLRNLNAQAQASSAHPISLQPAHEAGLHEPHSRSKRVRVPRHRFSLLDAYEQVGLSSVPLIALIASNLVTVLVNSPPPCAQGTLDNLSCKLTSRAAFSMGLVQARRHDNVSAAAWLSHAVAADPSLQVAYYLRGREYFALGEYLRAAEDYTQVIQMDSDDAVLARVYYDRGLAYYESSNFAQAIADYSRAIQLSPHDALAYCALGLAQWQAGDLPEAISHLERGVRLDVASEYRWCGDGLQEVIRGLPPPADPF